MEQKTAYINDSEFQKAKSRILTTGLVDYAANQGKNPQEYDQEFYGFQANQASSPSPESLGFARSLLLIQASRDMQSKGIEAVVGAQLTITPLYTRIVPSKLCPRTLWGLKLEMVGTALKPRK